LSIPDQQSQFGDIPSSALRIARRGGGFGENFDLKYIKYFGFNMQIYFVGL
jgi:hypothetical protein